MHHTDAQDAELALGGIEALTEPKRAERWMRPVEIAAAGLLVIMIVTVLANVFFRYVLAKPLTAMTTAMRRLASGDTSVPVPAAGRKDEVGQMAAAFNAILLFVVAGYVLYEGVKRIFEPEPVGSIGMLAVAAELHGAEAR